MGDIKNLGEFENSFHAAAERHERVWLFISMVLLAVLMVGTAGFVVADYGVVAKTYSFVPHPENSAETANNHELVKTGPNAYTIHVLAHLWQWEPGVIHVPQGAAITFVVTSKDVLHGFEVQGTTINLTAIPGTVGTVTYTFRNAGEHNVICNEYCGIEHQGMIGRIIVDGAKKS